MSAVSGRVQAATVRRGERAERCGCIENSRNRALVGAFEWHLMWVGASEHRLELAGAPERHLVWVGASECRLKWAGAAECALEWAEEAARRTADREPA